MEELRSARTPDELASVVRRAGVQGALGSETAVLMEHSLSFSAKTAADVMTPRTRLRTVSASASVTTVIEATRETGHSRFPVIGDSIDDIWGVVHVKQAVAVPELDRSATAGPGGDDTAGARAALHGLGPVAAICCKNAGLQLAVVVDEYGGTAGIVTFEDLVEELVGDVVDEHDSPAPGIRRQPDGTWLMSGLLRPDEIQAAIGLELPAGRADYETVAGLILQLLGRYPTTLATASTCPAPRSPWSVWTVGGSIGSESPLALTITEVTRCQRPPPPHRTDDEGRSEHDGRARCCSRLRSSRRTGSSSGLSSRSSRAAAPGSNRCCAIPAELGPHCGPSNSCP